MNRRTFIGASVAATLSAAAKPAWAADSAHQIDRIGLQLYTVRGTMKTDFAGTIAKVASTGYKEVEFAGYFGHSPKEVRELIAGGPAGRLPVYICNRCVRLCVGIIVRNRAGRLVSRA